MITNSPFEAHGITHLSASQINSWVSDPAGYLGGLAGLTSVFGPAAWRGTASEKGIHDVIANGTDGMEAALNSFDNEAEENGPIFAKATVNKERASIPYYIAHGSSLYKNLGELVDYQAKIVVEFDELEIPFVGYVDFVFEKSIRDTKTANRKPSQMTAAASRQLSIYAMAYPEHHVWVDYITPREVISYKHTTIKKYQKQVLQIALGLRKFLAISNDPLELCSMLYPNTDDWRWNKDMVGQVKKIWRY